MIELDASGQPWGHPWHGLYKSETGVIETPRGGDVRLPGTAPAGGDCYKIQVPGLDEVATPPEDAAAGRTWLNYAIMSGNNHCLYGKDIGKNRWVYIDPDGKPWLAELAWAAPWTTGTVTIKEFGRFGPMDEVRTQTLSFTLPASELPGNAADIDDINAQGNQVALVTHDSWWATYSGAWHGIRYLKDGYCLTLSGVPPHAHAAGERVFKDSDVVHEDDVVSSYSYTYSTTLVARIWGLAFDRAGSLHPVRSIREQQGDKYGGVFIRGIEIGGSRLEIPVSYGQDGVNIRGGHAVLRASGSDVPIVFSERDLIGPYHSTVRSVSGSYRDIYHHALSPRLGAPEGGIVGTHHGWTEYSVSPDPHQPSNAIGWASLSCVPRRLGNGVFAMVENRHWLYSVGTGGARWNYTPDRMICHGIISPVSVDSTMFDYPQVGHNLHASRHPDTNEIRHSTTGPVCWV